MLLFFYIPAGHSLCDFKEESPAIKGAIQFGTEQEGSRKLPVQSIYLNWWLLRPVLGKRLGVSAYPRGNVGC